MVVKTGCTGQHGSQRPSGREAGDQAKKRSPLPIAHSKNSRWRALALISIHVVFLVHVTHWLVTGSTLSPVEPSESMETLELGWVNAGFVLFSAAIVSTLLFGRFFCGWGCHVVALQDLSAWIMKKIGIRPKPFRSRLLVWVPMILAFYMFVWPLFKRAVLFPLFPATQDMFLGVSKFQGWKPHFTEQNFFETFAGWTVAIPFFFICGFATVYFLGSKGFCTYGCPYGGFFQLADRVSPGKIVANLDHCERCGHCTATCTSNVRVHEEIQVYGKVVSDGCMKCMDCVSVCPNNVLSFGFEKPTLFSPRVSESKLARKYDLTWKEELFLAAVFMATFFAVRSPYGMIPMLMAVGIAGCVTFITFKALRLWRDREVRLHRFVLKRAGSIRGSGWTYVAITAAILGFVIHIGWMNQTVRGAEASFQDTFSTFDWRETLGPEPPTLERADEAAARASLDSYRTILPVWSGGRGVLPTEIRYREYVPTESGLERNIVKIGLHERIALLHLALGEYTEAAAALDRVVRERNAAGSADDVIITDLARIYYKAGNTEAGIRLLEAAFTRFTDSERIRDHLVDGYVRSRDVDAALGVYRRWLERHPLDGSARAALGSGLLQVGRETDGLVELRRAALDAPGIASIHCDLAWALAKAARAPGDFDEAIREMQEAARLEPRSKEYQQFVGILRQAKAQAQQASNP